MPSPPERTMFGYSLHARNRDGIIDYPEFFRQLSEVRAAERQSSVGNEFVAISYMDAAAHGWLMRFVAGEEGVPTLVYDPSTGEEQLTSFGGRGFVASANWVLVDPERRLVAIERRRPGVGVVTIARALGHMGSELGILDQRTTFDLNPVVAESFVAAVHDYERIRQASIVLARPNFNWGDNAGDLTDYAGESNADDVEIAMSARRGESLSKEQGIIHDILNVTKSIVGPVKNLRVVGRRAGEKKETAVSLKKHQEKRSFPVPTESNLAAEREGFGSTAQDFIGQMASRSDDDGK